jgi:uncharacterized protein YndB with AHSA1/START domain
MTRIFKCDRKTLFQAIADGALFECTTPIKSRSHIDFSKNGKYSLDWSDDIKVHGEFVEIKPFEQVIFSWIYFSKTTQTEVRTLVQVSIIENEGKSTLTLKHMGFTADDQLHSHFDGWDKALGQLRQTFLALFAKMENNLSGLDLYFKIERIIAAPVQKVFAAVRNPVSLKCFFSVDSSAPFEEGAAIQWKFDKWGPYLLNIHKVVENEVIKFSWVGTHVCFSFRALDDSKTCLSIECTGWPATQTGVESSLSECNGWTEFLLLLDSHLNGKLSPQH